jgi:hypothetical protein
MFDVMRLTRSQAAVWLFFSILRANTERPSIVRRARCAPPLPSRIGTSQELSLIMNTPAEVELEPGLREFRHRFQVRVALAPAWRVPSICARDGHVADHIERAVRPGNMAARLSV